MNRDEIQAQLKKLRRDIKDTHPGSEEEQYIQKQIYTLESQLQKFPPPSSISSREQFKKLLNRLDQLNDNEFQKMIMSLLTPSEQHNLTIPRTRAGFLNDMRIWSKLDEVETYLCEAYSDRFPCA